MSDTSAPLESFALDAEARDRISVRLSAGLAGIGVFALGALLGTLRPDEWQVAELLQACAALIVGIPTLISGVKGIVTGDSSRTTDQLVAIAVIAAAATGRFATATVIPLVLEIGRLFEERGALGARAAIEGIRALGARDAVRVRGDVEERVPPSALVPGDVILVRPGERIAVDGHVLEGRAAIDPSAITGESLHQEVSVGSPVFAGTVCLDGALRIEVKSVGGGTVLGKVVKLLAEVEQAAVPILRLFERRAGVWFPLVLTISATILFFTRDLSRAITALIVASPTALVVAGPAAVIAGMSVATRLRVLIKSADFFERAADVDTLIIDKTGTVTVGTPTVAEIIPEHGHDEQYVLALAAACGAGSIHPISRAVVAAAESRGYSFVRATELQERPGLGVIATVGPDRIVLGRRSLLTEIGVQLPDEIDAASGSEVWVAENDHCIGHIVLRDQPRAEALEALSGVRAAGIDRIILLTGDRASVAREVGDALGVDDVVAEVLPEQKLEVVRAQQAAGRIVMMVGDGVNDAPALAGADLGIVIGAELNEIALGGADVALLGNDLRRVSQLVRLAEATRGILAQNVWLAFGFSGVLIALAAAGTLQPITGAVAQSLAVVAVVLNSARILRVPLEAPPVVVEPLESLPPDPPPTLATEPVAEAIVETATSPEHDD